MNFIANKLQDYDLWTILCAGFNFEVIILELNAYIKTLYDLYIILCIHLSEKSKEDNKAIVYLLRRFVFN